jgi:regulator of protease activity HflC (stomatin/prohibitin superfamily)
VQDAQGYKAKKVANAEGEADRFSKLLAEYERAPAVTRERLYIETIERVLKSSRKVFLDTKGDGSNLCTCRSTSCSSRADAYSARSPRRTVTIEGTTHDIVAGRKRSSLARDTLMANRGFLSIAGLIVVALALAMSTFTVRETELAMKLRFGEIVRADTSRAALQAPFYHEVHKFERRITTRNYPSEQFLTSEGKILRIDFYIKCAYPMCPGTTSGPAAARTSRPCVSAPSSRTASRA